MTYRSKTPAQRARAQSNLGLGKHQLEILVAYDYVVTQCSEYHFKINKRLNIWPSSKKWFDQKTMRKGEYTDLIKFVKEFLPIK